VDLENHLHVREVGVEGLEYVDHGHFDQVRRRSISPAHNKANETTAAHGQVALDWFHGEETPNE
jgi:hypothetical protein